MKTKTVCLCGSRTSQHWATVNSIAIVTCNDCGIRRVSEVDTDEYEKLYTSGEYHTTGSPDLPHAEANRDPHKERFDKDVVTGHKRIKALSAYKNKGCLIDVGCANGAVVSAADVYGFDAYGVDLSDEAVPDFLRDRVRIGDLGHTGFSRRTVDVVMFNDSFEHFTDPLTSLRYAHGLLKRDGILVIDIPDMGCALATEKGAEFHHVKPHEHLWYLTANQLRTLLEREGFTVLGMEVPVPGKVTAYASPEATVTHVNIYGPAGSGDIIWTLNKLKTIRDREAPCRINYVVCATGERKLATRSRDFLELCTLVDSVTFEPLPNPPDKGCMDVSKPEYHFIANGFVDAKKPPFAGDPIENWHPDIPPSWDVGIETPAAALEQARLRLRNVGPYVAVYMSSDIYNDVTLKPGWMPRHWAELCVKIKQGGMRPVILGAEWDLNFCNEVAGELLNMGHRPSDIWVNLVGKTPYPLAMAYMQLARTTVGIASGLPITAAQLGWKTIILWPVHGVSDVRVCRDVTHGWTKEFPYSWCPPELRTSGTYIWRIVGEFTVDTLAADVLNHARRATDAAAQR